MIEWEGEKDGKYSVKSYYAVLAKERAYNVLRPHERDDNFPQKHIWSTSILFRAAFLH